MILSKCGSVSYNKIPFPHMCWTDLHCRQYARDRIIKWQWETLIFSSQCVDCYLLSTFFVHIVTVLWHHSQWVMYFIFWIIDGADVKNFTSDPPLILTCLMIECFGMEKQLLILHSFSDVRHFIIRFCNIKDTLIAIDFKFSQVISIGHI